MSWQIEGEDSSSHMVQGPLDEEGEETWHDVLEGEVSKNCETAILSVHAMDGM